MWMLLAIVAPEIVLTYAAGQWSTARHPLNDFHKAGYQQWTIRMAFFADMGGFVLEYPETDVDEIWDKSKQDRFARLVTTFQVGYTILYAIGRAC
ncbi:hypothetical protein C8A03DRAFT_36455 [Achaetomium macrosporum]|uniref:Uncharacterized protein n=1 Tax=Achaetomium macrosporum TaxID=79813 RepID=A0AAN7HBZ6_9PEZI|nr:hypothetical protein C8A03DRAFT_36455 [Achaetomium macrosporum]